VSEPYLVLQAITVSIGLIIIALFVLIGIVVIAYLLFSISAGRRNSVFRGSVSIVILLLLCISIGFAIRSIDFHFFAG